MLNLVHLPHLLAQLGLQKDDGLELYMHSNHGNFWIPTIDHSMTVKTDKKIYIWQKGVLTSLHLSTFVNLLVDCGSPSISFEMPTSRKRAHHDSQSITPMLECPSKIAFLDLTGDDDDVESLPALSLSSPSIQAARTWTFFASPTLQPKSRALVSASVDLLDQIWLSGSVVTPEATGIVWPNQIYVWDMAQAFAFLANSTNQGDLPSHFSHVFNGMTFKQSMYHLN